MSGIFSGVKFGAYHSYNDWALILSQKEIGLPAVKTTTVDIPASDGVLDLTEVIAGRVCYGNRTLTFTFVSSPSLTSATWAELLAAVSGAIHGQRLDIILDDDAAWKYTGRVTLDSFATSRAKHTIVIKCDCAPYKTSVTDATLKSL